MVFFEDYKNPERIRHAVNIMLNMGRGIDILLAKDDPERLFVVKPNWIQDAHEYKDHVWEPVITHPELILCVLQCLAERIQGRATICVCDAPHTYADFAAIVKRGEFQQRFEALTEKFPSIKFEVLDLRREVWTRKEEVVVERCRNPDDPRGYVKVDLGSDSLFYGHVGEGRFYGADYDSTVVNSHHRGKIQEYLIAGTPISCDLFINLPKMKTHKKTGITCCLKNLVGINGDKNWLPHYTEGGPVRGGDEFPEYSFLNRFESNVKKIGRKMALKIPGLGTWLYRKMRHLGKQCLGDSGVVIRNGNWSGNDTCWRMVLDLNRALLYANTDGTWRDRFQPKAYLAIVDGVIGGQGDGPLCPDPVQSNVLVSGTNPAEVDAVVAKLMGFAPNKLPVIKNAFEPHRWPIATGKMEDIKVFDGRAGHEVGLSEVRSAVEGGLTPHFGWKNLQDEE
ncbi:MAG: DUF362 domain-containing protein [Desulfobacterales bacterium]|nr:DUF362 domain-containing protein [Desulfobacterales bacterium]